MAIVMAQRLGKRGPLVAKRTGPLTCLSGKRVLVVADGQNLDHGAKDLDCTLNWAELGRRLHSASDTAWCHVVFARAQDDGRRAGWFARVGWTPSAKTRRWLFRGGRRQLDANADNLVSFQVAALLSRVAADLVVIGTGDGQLAEDVAEAVHMLDSRCRVVTMSLAGSTATRLDARTSRLIAANIEIGRDCLDPIRVSNRVSVQSGQLREWACQPVPADS